MPGFKPKVKLQFKLSAKKKINGEGKNIGSYGDRVPESGWVNAPCLEGRIIPCQGRATT